MRGHGGPGSSRPTKKRHAPCVGRDDSARRSRLATPAGSGPPGASDGPRGTSGCRNKCPWGRRRSLRGIRQRVCGSGVFYIIENGLGRTGSSAPTGLSVPFAAVSTVSAQFLLRLFQRGGDDLVHVVILILPQAAAEDDPVFAVGQGFIPGVEGGVFPSFTG